MDYPANLERLKPHWVQILFVLTGFVLLLYVLIPFVTPKKDKPDILFDAVKDERPLVKEVENKHVTVDVEGAVEKPGVYDLPSGARVQDALIAVGGMSSDANRDKVAKSLNLGAKLSDGGKIYIPFLRDSLTGNLAAGEGTDRVLGAQTGLININAASTKDLDSLPGVGTVSAEKIISRRPYGSIEELVSKKIVSEKVYNEIKDRISIY